MAVALRAVGALGNTANSAANPMTSSGQTIPAGTAAGDLLVMFAWFDTGATTTGQNIAVSGGSGAWTDQRSVVGVSLPAQSMIFAVFTRTAIAGETAPTVTFTGGTTGTSGGSGLVRIIGLTGADTASPIGIIGAAFQNTSAVQNIGAIAAPAATLPIGDLVFVYAGKADDWTSVATLSGDSLTWVEDVDSPVTVGGDAGLVVDHAINAGGGAATLTSKTFTVTGGATAKSVGRIFSIKQAPATASLDQKAFRLRRYDQEALNGAFV